MPGGRGAADATLTGALHRTTKIVYLFEFTNKKEMTSVMFNILLLSSFVNKRRKICKFYSVI